MRSEIPARAPYASGSRASCAGPSAQRAEADDLVDFSVIALPGGWVRIAIEDNARARPDARTGSVRAGGKPNDPVAECPERSNGDAPVR